MRDPALERFEALFGPEFGHGKPFDLDRLRAALAKLGNPQDRLPPVIHVAGSNGKGSTVAFTRVLAMASGLRVHDFTKPHIFNLSERFRMADETVRIEEPLIEAAERVAAVDGNLTQFDAQVAAAFLLFSETPADFVIFETGMGGRDDSTNVLGHPAATVITPIGLDHQDVLGTTLAEIAAHKADILKPGAPAIVARQQDAAREVIEAKAERIGTPLFRQGVEWDAFAEADKLVVQTDNRLMEFWSPGFLRGAHQFDNAGLAVATLLAANLLPADIDRNIARAPSSAHLYAHGRLEPLRGPLVEPIYDALGTVTLDGGHNAHAASALARWLIAPPASSLPAVRVLERRRHLPGSRIAIIGMRERKDADAFLTELIGAVDKIFTVPLSEPHIWPPDLARRARELGFDASPMTSLAFAMKNAAQFPAPRVLICGSFVLVKDAIQASHNSA